MLLIPAEYNWESLTVLRCADLESHYSTLLRELGTQKGILGKIFTKSQNKNKDPAKISKLIDMIDKEQWNVLGADVKARYTKGCWRRTLKTRRRSRSIFHTTCSYKSNGRMPAP